jgi:hypothetical protein
MPLARRMAKSSATPFGRSQRRSESASIENRLQPKMVPNHIDYTESTLFSEVEYGSPCGRAMTRISLIRAPSSLYSRVREPHRDSMGFESL